VWASIPLRFEAACLLRLREEEAKARGGHVGRGGKKEIFGTPNYYDVLLMLPDSLFHVATFKRGEGACFVHINLCKKIEL
jgi:hypothetical protein